MKDNEQDYLDKLFTPSSRFSDEAEVELPLLDVPQKLNDKLYAIAAVDPTAKDEQSLYRNWPKVSSIAASLLLAFIGFQFFQQQQTLNQLEQAQADLATALHYLGEANRITQEQVLNSLNNNMNKARIKPAMEIEQETLTPNSREFESEVNKHNRTL